jgi:hypothetical protein
MLASSPDEKEGEEAQKSADDLARSLNKIMPHFFSYWNVFYALLLIGAAIGLFFIQAEEEAEAAQSDSACYGLYKDIHYSKMMPAQQRNNQEGV